jgi:hypothetical protein
MCSGVVPQQPPMMFTKLSSKYSLIKLASVLAFHHILKAFGNPALGCADTLKEVFCDKFVYGFNRSAQEHN